MVELDHVVEEVLKVINDNGLPERSGEIEYVGTAYPKWKAGLYNEFSYKNFTLSVLLDG